MDVSQAQDMLRELAGVIGFTLQEKKAASREIEAKITELIEKRNAFRKAKDWKQADQVRSRLPKWAWLSKIRPKARPGRS